MHTQEVGQSPLNGVLAELDSELSRHSWGQPVRLFALVRSDELIDSEPALAAELKLQPGTLTSVEQDGFDPNTSVENLLPRIGWPKEVIGAAVAVERLILPPGAEADLGGDTEADDLVQAVADHEQKVDMRIITAVTRDGDELTMLRMGAPYDQLLQGRPGEKLAPDLTALLHATFTEDQPA
jgi:hypothetical protein